MNSSPIAVAIFLFPEVEVLDFAGHLRSQRVLSRLDFEPLHSEIVHQMTMLIFRRRPPTAQ